MRYVTETFTSCFTSASLLTSLKSTGYKQTSKMLCSVYEQTNTLTTLNFMPGYRPFFTTSANYRAEVALGHCRFQFYREFPGYSFTPGHSFRPGNFFRSENPNNRQFTPRYSPAEPERCIREKSQAEIDKDIEYMEEMKKEAGYTGQPYVEEEEPDFWSFIRTLRDKIGDDCIDTDQNYFISAHDYH